jgi:peptidoglycan/LPS O-acetylase OafA/YrhL
MPKVSLETGCTHVKTDNTVIEAWRGLAAWMVLYTHYWAFGEQAIALGRFAHTGVDLFFVISGFVFAPYWWGTSLIGPRQLAAFVVRRFFRIYPAYVAALLVYVWLKSVSGAPLLYVTEHLTFFHVQSREMAFYYNAPFWSLPAEVEFYVALPLMCWLTQKIKGGFALVCIAAIVLRLVLGDQHQWETQNSAYIALHHLPGLLCEFMLGALAWKAWKGWKFNSSTEGLQAPSFTSISLLFIVGLGAWLALAQYFAIVGDEGVRTGVLKGQMGLLAAASFALMLLGSVLLQQRLLTLKTPFAENLQNSKNLKTLALLVGKVSYGVYLLHIASLTLVSQYAHSLLNESQSKWAAAGLTLLASWLLHEIWEGPLRAKGRNMAQKILKS